MVTKLLHFLRTHTPKVILLTYHKVLAYLAAFYYRFPSREFITIGVTGTDGKTTTCSLIAHILEKSFQRVGLITTIEYKIGPKTFPNKTRMTTPGRFSLQKLLRQMAREKIDYAVLETTSHALAQGRVLLVDYDIAVVTNITHEHLDYHGTLQAYQKAKTKLFQYLNKSYKKGFLKTSILNSDDSSYRYLSQVNTERQLTYGIKNKADIQAWEVKSFPTHSIFKVKTPKGGFSVKLPLPAEYNIYNALAAISVAVACGVGIEEIKNALESFKGVRGRLEQVEVSKKQNFDVIVDYAHTPESFRKVFSLFRPLVKGKIWAVFGSAGERDVEKRPRQGEIAGKLADFVVITDEDPRFEDRYGIIDQIGEGTEKAGKKLNKNYWKIPDRKKAIRFAILQAQKDDLVLILGKGHESSIIYEGRKLPWSDAKAAKEALRARFRS